MANLVQGLAPYLPPARPRSAARWWAAAGTVEPSFLRLDRLDEAATAPPVVAPCGLAAPCSLPAPFLDFLGVRSSLAVEGPRERLFRRAREFAAAAKRGYRHPLRVPHESLSVLDRRRLPLFLCALPLLRGDAAPLLFEVDVAAILRALGLPHVGLAGDAPAAVDGRALVLEALCGGALGFRVETPRRDYAIASLPALAAILSCAMAARVRESGVSRPAGAETWVPLP
jgi:hypothetical protein